jgi:hypothetical protein
MGDGLTRQGGRALGLDHEAAYGRVPLLEGGRTPGEGAARPHEIAENVDPASGLPQDFRAGVQVVGSKIPRQPELIRPEGVPLCDETLGCFLHALQILSGDL